MSLVVYPGTFDPLTLGHQDVVNRVAAHHESVVVAISDSRSNTLFTMGVFRTMLVFLLQAAFVNS